MGEQNDAQLLTSPLTVHLATSTRADDLACGFFLLYLYAFKALLRSNREWPFASAQGKGVRSKNASSFLVISMYSLSLYISSTYNIRKIFLDKFVLS